MYIINKYFIPLSRCLLLNHTNTGSSTYPAARSAKDPSLCFKLRSYYKDLIYKQVRHLLEKGWQSFSTHFNRIFLFWGTGDFLLQHQRAFILRVNKAQTQKQEARLTRITTSVEEAESLFPTFRTLPSSLCPTLCSRNQRKVTFFLSSFSA